MESKLHSVLKKQMYLDTSDGYSCRGVLEAAWNRALSATDWAAVAAERAHCSDADFGRLLSATLVARAAARCFSPFAHHRLPLAPRWLPLVNLPECESADLKSLQIL